MTVDTTRRMMDLRGPAMDRGLDHGHSTGTEIRAVLDDVCLAGWEDDPIIARRLDRELEATARIGGAGYVEEMVGIAVGAGIPFEAIARLNLIVGSDSVPGVCSIPGMYRATCSAIALIDPEVGPVCGKNGDAERHQGRWYWGQRIHPDHGPSMLGTTYVGTVWLDSGINEHGLAVVPTAGPGRMDQGPGLPSCIYPQFILEHARTVEEAIEVIDETPMSGFGMVFVIVDAKSSIAIVEKAADHSAVRPPSSSFTWAVNTFETDKMLLGAVTLPLAGLDDSNGTRCAAFEAIGAGALTTVSELIATLRTPPIWQQGPGSFWSVHTAIYNTQARSLLLGRDDPTVPLVEFNLDDRSTSGMEASSEGAA